MLYSCSLWHTSCLPPQGRCQASRRPLYPQSPPRCSTAACPTGFIPLSYRDPPGPHQTTPLSSRSFPLPAAARATARVRRAVPALCRGAGRALRLLSMVRAALSPSSRPQTARIPFPLPSARSARADSSLSTAPRRSCRRSPAGTPPNVPGLHPLYGREEPLCSAVAQRRALSMVPRATCGGCCWAAAASRAACRLPPAPRSPPPPTETLPTAAAPRGECGPHSLEAARPARPSRREGRRHRLVFCRCCDAPGCRHGGPRHGREREGRRQPLPGLLPRYSVLDAVTWVRSGRVGGGRRALRGAGSRSAVGWKLL